MSRQKRDKGNENTATLRAALEADVQAYLDSGKKIEQVPAGFTNQDPLGGRRHIVLGPKKSDQS
jgi:hypothetical protein